MHKITGAGKQKSPDHVVSFIALCCCPETPKFRGSGNFRFLALEQLHYIRFCRSNPLQLPLRFLSLTGYQSKPGTSKAKALDSSVAA